MLVPLRRAVCDLWVSESEAHTWLVLEEQLLHSRIADLLLVRMDIEAIRARVDGGFGRPLALNELRLLRAMRPDRATSLAVVATQARMPEARAVAGLRRLASDGFVHREARGFYRRLVPVRPLAPRVITFEAKRSDPRGALTQARAHRMWANEAYVAFDAQYAARFRAMQPQYARAGIGLLELSPVSWDRVLRSRPQSRARRLETALVGERVLGRLLGLPAGDRPERRLAHGARLSAESPPLLIGPGSAWLATLDGSTKIV
jgi:hypothetical protein